MRIARPAWSAFVRVGGRILLIVAVTAIGFCVIAGNTLFGTRQISATWAEASGQNALATLALRTHARVADLRIAEMRLVATGNPALLSLVNDITGQINRGLDDMRSRATGAFAEPVDRASARIRAYQAAIAAYAETLQQLGSDALTEGLSASIWAEGDRVERLGSAAPEAAREALSRDVVTRLRYAELRMRAGQFPPEIFAGAVQRTVNGVRRSTELDEATRAEAIAALERYGRTVAQWVELKERAEAEIMGLGTAFDAATTALEQIAQRASAARNEAESAFSDTLGTVSSVLFLGLGVTFVLVCAISLVVGRSVTRPLRRLTAAMGRLAAGDSDSPVPDGARRDEIGEMARALEVFRDNAKALAVTEARRLETEERAADERRAMLVELSREIGAVVEAAAGGDFSRRVERRFADPEIAALGSALNRLADTVERGLSETCLVLEALGDGQLDRRIEVTYAGAFGSLRDGTNTLADRLDTAIGRIRVAAGTLGDAGRDMAQGARDLSDRTAVQGATLEETAAALVQFAETVRTNSERAARAADLFGAMREGTEHGSNVMTSAEAAMREIGESSQRIASVVGLIDDISFQTNLLALNASVEAARAGEAGRGFAVVATEVRRLAQHAASASGDIKKLIVESQDEVARGMRLVGDATSAISAIAASVKQVSGVVDEIARASADQSIAVGEITIAMQRMDQMTQQNSTLVDQTSGAATATLDQVEALSATLAALDRSAGDKLAA